MTRERDPITELRNAIDQLPVQTRQAMLDGVRGNEIIVGAYTDSSGGICPMLAAHRNGGRTTMLAFAKSWDRFAGGRRVRRATRREVVVLETQLTQSLGADPGPADLRAAIADHVALKDRKAEQARLAEQAKQARLAKQAEPVEEPQIQAKRLGGGRIGRLRPRRADAERALANLDQRVLEATKTLV